MQKTVFVLACLTCGALGSQVDRPHKKARSIAAADSLEGLARLLTAFNNPIVPAMSKQSLVLRSQMHAGVLAAMVALCVPASFAVDTGAIDIVAGSQIFSGKCAACHTGGGNLIEVEKTLEKDGLDAFLGSHSKASISKMVTKGKGAMPAFGTHLSPAEIQNVAAFVYDQAIKEKWG